MPSFSSVSRTRCFFRSRNPGALLTRPRVRVTHAVAIRVGQTASSGQVLRPGRAPEQASAQTGPGGQVMRTLRRRRAAALGAALIFLLASCGNESKKDATPTTNTSGGKGGE